MSISKEVSEYRLSNVVILLKNTTMKCINILNDNNILKCLIVKI